MTWKPAFVLPDEAVVPTPPVPAAPAPVVRIDEAVAEYRSVRDQVAAIKKRHTEELEPFKETLEQLGSKLLDALNAAGTNSMRTDAGTAYKSTKVTYSIDDPVAFRAWVEREGKPEFYENRVSQEVVKSFVNDGAVIPPGLKVSSFTTVNVCK